MASAERAPAPVATWSSGCQFTPGSCSGVAIWLFVAFLGVYLLLAAGHIESIDVSESIAASQQMVSHAVVWVTGFPTTPGGGVVPGVGGHLYSPHDIGLALIFLPISALVRLTSPPIPTSDLLYSLVDPVFAALLVTVSSCSPSPSRSA